MKLVALCLFAVFCCALFNVATTRTDRTSQKLQEVLRELNVVKKSLQHSEQMLNTPPNNIEDCCCLSALQCFRANLNMQFNPSEKNQKKLYRSLKNSLTERGLDFCNSQNVNSTCQDCDSHPKETAKEFFNRLESLIQKAIVRLRMN